jgi:hypothetical protein
MTKAGECVMKFLKTALAILLLLFVSLAAIYWFNLDTKLVKLLEKPMTRHYDDLPRDHRL